MEYNKDYTNLRNIRRGAGLNQYEFADRCGLSARHLQRYEQHKKELEKMDVLTALRIVVNMNESLASLFDAGSEARQLAEAYDERLAAQAVIVIESEGPKNEG